MTALNTAHCQLTKSLKSVRVCVCARTTCLIHIKHNNSTEENTPVHMDRLTQMHTIKQHEECTFCGKKGHTHTHMQALGVPPSHKQIKWKSSVIAEWSTPLKQP